MEDLFAKKKKMTWSYKHYNHRITENVYYVARQNLDFPHTPYSKNKH